MELIKKQIYRQDFVDNAIFSLLQEINPTTKEIDWDIEMIGGLRDEIRIMFARKFDNFSEQDFYPFIAE